MRMEMRERSEMRQLLASILVCGSKPPLLAYLFCSRKNVSAFLFFKICETQHSPLHTRLSVLILCFLGLLPSIHLP